MFHEFALEHAWLIPLLPAIAFVIIGGVVFVGTAIWVATSPITISV